MPLLSPLPLVPVEGTPIELLYVALETVNVSTGSGHDLVTIENTHAGTTTLSTGNGDDRIAIRTIAGATTVKTGDGTDTVAVGSQAGLWETDTTAGLFDEVGPLSYQR